MSDIETHFLEEAEQYHTEWAAACGVRAEAIRVLRRRLAATAGLVAACQAALEWRGLDGDGISNPVRQQVQMALAAYLDCEQADPADAPGEFIVCRDRLPLQATKVHEALEPARVEAVRLCRKEQDRFPIFQLLDEVAPGEQPVVWRFGPANVHVDR